MPAQESSPSSEIKRAVDQDHHLLALLNADRQTWRQRAEPRVAVTLGRDHLPRIGLCSGSFCLVASVVFGSNLLRRVTSAAGAEMVMMVVAPASAAGAGPPRDRGRSRNPVSRVWRPLLSQSTTKAKGTAQS